LTLFREFWAIAKPYWVSEERWAARALLATIIAINLAIVWVNVRLNTWNGEFYNSLQDKKFELFKSLVLEFGGWALLFIILTVYQQYLRQMLQIRWRKWLTEKWLERWTSNQAFYRLAVFEKGTDNPDQRIADDIKLFVEDTLKLSIDFLSSTVTFVSFVGILWALSGALEVAGVNIPGYMVWVAVAYAMLGSVAAHWVGKALVGLHVTQQRHEADFRYSLIRMRDNAEAIALYRAQGLETEGLKRRLSYVVSNWWEIMKQEKRFAWFSSFYGQIAIIFPLVVAAPKYFSGAIQLGGLMQISSAFGEVQRSLSWFVDAYTKFADWRSYVFRLTDFSNAMSAIENQQKSLEVIETTDASQPVRAEHLDMLAPDGRLLFNADGFSIAAGQHTVLNGPSGSGKSTLFRALAGLWPFAKGKLKSAPFADSMYLPQRPYLPLGTLRACITYPALETRFPDEQIVQILQALSLEKLASKLAVVEPWHAMLSPGEQQRLAIGRAVLNQPKWLFLDEATSALSESAELDMYKLMMEKIPQATLVSIAHRASVDQFHRQKFEIDVQAGRLTGSEISYPLPDR
jgi:vitamin B12/bleomycin/antimicrobial peptide transport system ATP-binding/permease protein